jgi:hypothetical protein
MRPEFIRATIQIQYQDAKCRNRLADKVSRLSDKLRQLGNIVRRLFHDVRQSVNIAGQLSDEEGRLGNVVRQLVSVVRQLGNFVSEVGNQVSDMGNDVCKLFESTNQAEMSRLGGNVVKTRFFAGFPCRWGECPHEPFTKWWPFAKERLAGTLAPPTAAPLAAPK